MMLPIVLLVTILASPIVTVEDYSVVAGSPLVLPCSPSISGALVLWYKDDTVLATEGHQDRFLILPDASLFFLSTVTTDSGSYYCTGSSSSLTVAVQDTTQDILEIEVPRDVSVTILSDSVLVEWADNPKAESYIVKVTMSDGKEATKNITVGRDITAVKLYNLLAVTEYSISVAVMLQGQVSAFSQAEHLNISEDISPILWIVSLTVVVGITILTILAVTVTVLKIRSFKHVRADIEEENPYEKPFFTSKRISRIESPWNIYVKKTAEMKTFRPDESLREYSSSDYDYASSDHYFLQSEVSSDYDTANTGYNTHSNHYASTVVNTLDSLH